MVNLSARSIKHFLPRADIHCITLFKEDYHSEYNEQEQLSDNIINIIAKTKHTNRGDNHSFSGNGSEYSEGYNIAYNIFKYHNEPVVLITEDHFFTNGSVLKEIVENRYDLAYAPGDRDTNASGSLLVINPQKVSHLFPIPSNPIPVESLLEQHLITKVDNRYQIQNRKHMDYCGDGIHTNNVEDMIRELKAVGIV